ncbi:MAG TPA: hypothetical protein VNM41_08555 [Solirubrobacterales bacterium]|nr:hypothetical protein [Solirubrobacterales bacterium]
MAVIPMPREKWTDERLDDLQAEMHRGFARVDADIRELRSEMNAGFDSIDARFDALNRNLLWGVVTVVVALIGSNVF